MQELDISGYRKGMGGSRAFLLKLPLAAAILSSFIGPIYADSGLCRPMIHEASRYTVCRVDLRQQIARVFWLAPNGRPYGHLASIPHSFDRRSGRLRFAINAGMYLPDYRPVGLYIEEGREFVRANTKPGPGNFHMRPNGVLYISGESGGVLEATSFLKQKLRPEFATQSGPMLVINGRLHPRFARSGGSRKFRDGVGNLDANTLLFAISEDEVSFGEFGRLFRDKLGCKNALFLDGGSVPSLYSPELGRRSNLLPLGPIIGVYDRAK